jgi:hypothetical protein
MAKRKEEIEALVKQQWSELDLSNGPADEPLEDQAVLLMTDAVVIARQAGLSFLEIRELLELELHFVEQEEKRQRREGSD